MKVFAGHFWPLASFASPKERYDGFLATGRPRFAQLLHDLMLYDEVVIPTQDFLATTALVDVLGRSAAEDLLDGGDIRFCRLKGGFVYIGNGGGLQSFQITDDEKRPDMPFAEKEQALDAARDAHASTKGDVSFSKKVLSLTSEIRAADIQDELRDETYRDVLDSPYLHGMFGLRSTHMDKLKGIGPAEVRSIALPDGPTWKGDEIDIVMALAAANVELRMASLSSCEDASTVAPVGHLMKAKFERTFHSAGGSTPFVRLVDVAGLPDLGALVVDRAVEERAKIVRRLLKLKRSKNGQAFRTWFHKECRTAGADVAKEYIKLLEQESKLGSWPVRILRFLVTTALGFVPGVGGAVVGTAASAGDSFLLDRMLRGASPKFFIQDLRQIQLKFGPPVRSKIVTSG